MHFDTDLKLRIIRNDAAMRCRLMDTGTELSMRMLNQWKSSPQTCDDNVVVTPRGKSSLACEMLLQPSKTITTLIIVVFQIFYVNFYVIFMCVYVSRFDCARLGDGTWLHVKYKCCIGRRPPTA